MVPEVPLQPPGSGATVVGTEFTNISSDDIEEVWRDHVATLLKGKSEAAAVNTMFLLNRLFLVSAKHAVLLVSYTSRFVTQPLILYLLSMHVHTTILYTI